LRGVYRNKAGRKKNLIGGDAPVARSKVTNGTKMLPGIDGRSPWCRRLKDLMGLLMSDLGGVDNTSEAERSIIRRAATLEVELEILEYRFASAGNGAQPEDLDLYQRAAGNLRRLFEAVGVRRRPRNITPTLSEYISQRSNGTRPSTPTTSTTLKSSRRLSPLIANP
jgi:hypothetical protein